MPRILIVDDHALVREAIARRLALLGRGVKCIEAASASEALHRLEAAGRVDLVVTDLIMPGDSGFSLLTVLGKRFPDLPVVVVSAMDDEASLRRAIQAGASAYVSKSRSGDVLAHAVQVVLDGGSWLPAVDAIGGRGGGGSRPRLTAAQQRVLDLLAEGRSNRAIADSLGIAEATVKVHVSAIFRALGVNSRAQTVAAVARDRSRASRFCSG